MKLIKEIGIKNIYLFKEIHIDLSKNKQGDLYRDIYIYGKNNVGKSLFMKTLDVFSTFIELNASPNFEFKKLGLMLPSFDEQDNKQAFLISFEDENTEYKYEIEFNKHKNNISFEQLISKSKQKSSREKKLFIYDIENGENIFELHQEFPSAIKEYFKSRDISELKRTLLSQLASFEHEEVKNAFEIITSFKYINYSDERMIMRERRMLRRRYYDNDEESLFQYSFTNRLKTINDDGKFGMLKNIISHFDLSIKEMVFEEKVMSKKNLESDDSVIHDRFMMHSRFKIGENEDSDNKYYYYLKFIDDKHNKKSWSNQSDGTRKILDFVAWLLFNSISSKNILLIDEADAGVHPILFERVMREFMKDDEHNTIIYVTHNPYTLDIENLEPGQVIFMDRDSDGSLTYGYLSDFNIRKDVSNSRKYIGGLFGGVPNISENEQK